MGYLEGKTGGSGQAGGVSNAAGLGSKSSGVTGGFGQAGGVLNAAGLGSKSAGVPKGDGYVETKGASGSPCRSLPVSRGKDNVFGSRTFAPHQQ